jgi:hypothetical protein
MPRPSLLVAATLAVLLPACGHRGDPLPPLRRTPPPLQDFRLAQRGDALELRAIAPGASTDGVPYEAVTVEFLHVEGQKDLEKAGSRRAVRARPGQRVAFTLPLPVPGTLVRAAARGIAGKERGPRTLTMALVAQAPLEAPRELTAVLAEDGVALQWLGLRPKEIPPPVLAPTPGGPPVAGPPNPFAPAPPKPATLAPPKPAAPAETGKEPEGAEKAGGVPATEGVVAGPRRSGFFVYRRVGGAEHAEPVAEEPLERRTVQDESAPLGATVCYVVRAVGSTQPLVESAPSNEACVAVRDVAAPATPAGLAVLPREGGLEVLWSPSAEPDLAGYRVYRTAPGVPREKVAEAATNRSAWLDETARRGVVYRYAVTAVDQAGNESEPTEEVEASLP